MREEKGNILREVYEDNKRIKDRSFLESKPPMGKTGAAVLAAVVVIIALYLLAGEFFSDPKLGPAPESSSLTIPVPIDSSLSRAILRDPDLSALSESEKPLSELFDLTIRTVVIDAGHGGNDSGASGSAGLQEKEITLDVSQRLARRLRSEHGLSVFLSRDEDRYISLRERVEFSNTKQADLFISIHVNYIPTERVYAIETYYFGSQSDDSALRLAEVENQNSDYSVADFNRMIGAIGSRVKLQESERLARSVQSSLMRNVQSLNKDVQDWGIKSAPFVVLLGVDAPGILAEIGVISNGDEEARLATPEYREQLALFLEEGVVNYLSTMTQASQEND